MSHCSGTVTFGDGLVLHCLYQNTADVMLPYLVETHAQTWDVIWKLKRDPKTDKVYAPDGTEFVRECMCGRDEPARIANENARSESGWDGRACRHCRVITDGFEQFPEDYGR